MVSSLRLEDLDTTSRPPDRTRSLELPISPDTITLDAAALASIVTQELESSSGDETSAKSPTFGCEPVLQLASRCQGRQDSWASFHATPEQTCEL